MLNFAGLCAEIPRQTGAVEISSDRALLDLWRERTGFWLTEDGS
ncbi:hypothetical protein AB0E01_14490 [Nocardia vinacea]